MICVKGEILRWARESAGLTIEEAAKLLHNKDGGNQKGIDELKSYEEKSNTFSRNKVLKFSKAYRRAMLIFYLDSPPQKDEIAEDFRASPADIPRKENSPMNALLRNIKSRQNIIRDMLVSEDEGEKVEFVGRCSMQDDTATIARLIVQEIGFDLECFRRQPTPDEAFKYARAAVEKKGVFVVLASNLGSYHTNISSSIFRGFALSDKIAPFIVINNTDSKPALAFTLFHELAHIFIGKTGASNNTYDQVVEKFCNDIACDVLLPDDLSCFLRSADQEALKREIKEFSNRNNISCSFLAYTLYRRKIINKGIWQSLHNYYKQQYNKEKEGKKGASKQNSGGPNYYVLRKFHVGKKMLRLVKRMNEAGALTTVKSAFVLGVKPTNVHKMYK